MHHGAELCARAFERDPFYAWLLPRIETRVARSTRIMRVALRRCDVHTIEGGLAAWHMPGDRAGMAWSDLWHAAALLPSVMGRLGKLRRFARDVAAARPEGHVHLELLAVDPTMHGRGLGRTLLEHVFAVAGATPIVLETTNPSNVDLYRRFGFELAREVRVDDVPPAWTMIRAPIARDP